VLLTLAVCNGTLCVFRFCGSNSAFLFLPLSVQLFVNANHLSYITAARHFMQIMEYGVSTDSVHAWKLSALWYSHTQLQIIFTEHTHIVINILTGSARAQAGSHGLSLQRPIANVRPLPVGFVVEWDRLFSEYFSVCDSIIPPMSLLNSPVYTYAPTSRIWRVAPKCRAGA
jgi:hypothetical protein